MSVAAVPPLVPPPGPPPAGPPAPARGRMGRAWNATRGAVSRAASATSETLRTIKEGISTSPSVQAVGTKLATAFDVDNDGMPVDIVGDRYFLDGSWKGAADINTRENFLKNYGLVDGQIKSNRAIQAIYDVFKAPAPLKDSETKYKINTKEKAALLAMQDAFKVRVITLTTTINSLVNGTVIQDIAKYRLRRIQQVLDWIQTAIDKIGSGTGSAIPTTSISFMTPRYEELRLDKKDPNRKHQHIFNAIMGLAYYLANPDFLLDSEAPEYQDKEEIVSRFESVLELLSRGHLHDLVASIKSDRTLPTDVKDMDAMNYFERIRLKNILNTPTNAGVSGEIIQMIGLPSMSEVMSDRILSIMKLLQINKYIDEESYKIIDAAIKDKNIPGLISELDTIITDISGGAHQLVKHDVRVLIDELYESFQPIYRFYQKTYNPIFDYLENSVIGNRELPLQDMIKIFELGLDKYKQTDLSANFGVYKLVDVSSGFTDFILQLQRETRFDSRGMEIAGLRDAFAMLPNEILRDKTKERALGPRFPAKTPIIQFLLPNQFNFDRTVEDNDLIRLMNPPATRSAATARTPRAASTPAQPRVRQSRPSIGGGKKRQEGGSPESFNELQMFFSGNSPYMFVRHRTESKNFNPHIIDISNNRIDITPEPLKTYATLKIDNIVTVPKPNYVQLNIVLLAIASIITFNKRLKVAAGK
jgi:hypothetical protein